MGGGAVIRRKIRAAEGRKPDATVMIFAENLTGQIAEALLLEPKFTLHPEFVDAEVLSFKAFLTSTPPKSLYCYSRDILFHLDNELTYTWIEMGLSGEAVLADRVSERYAPSAIDASLSRPFFECLMTSLQKDLPKRYRVAETEYEDAMSLERLVDNVHFTDDSTKVVVLKYGFSRHDEVVVGCCRIVLPLSIIEEVMLSAKPQVRDDAPNTGVWTKHMRGEVLDLPLKIIAVLERTKMSVDEIARLAPGKHIFLSAENLSKVTLCAETNKGVRELATGRLGLHNRAKAIKLDDRPKSRLTAIVAASRRSPAG